MDVEDRHANAAHRVFMSKVDDSGDQQLIDYRGLYGEEHTKVLRVMPHGLSSHPPADSEAVMLGLGTRDMPVVVGGESPKHRPRDLPAGATRLYDTEGSFVYLDAGGNLHAKVNKSATIEAGETVVVKSATSVTVTSAKIVLDGAVEIKGDITHTGNLTSSGVHQAASHV
jgi:phage baseplate assembly protein V